MSALATLLMAWLFEAIVGWPDAVYRRIRHPVVWLGALIAWFDRHCNRDHDVPAVRRAAGALTTLAVTGVAIGVASVAVRVLPDNLVGHAIEIVVASSLLASRSLHDHVAAVARPLIADDLDGARHAVSHIVGRDPEQLDRSGVAGAALESLAENASDGVVAPLFWGALFGLPGIAACKAINTLDSMIGHRTDRHRAFGEFAARLDDLANWLPARLTGAAISLAALGPGGWRTMWRDARHHRSPNAGWPEAAMAGALNVRLSGPRCYGRQRSEEPWLNEQASAATPASVRQGLRLYVQAMLVIAAMLVLALALTANPGLQPA